MKKLLTATLCFAAYSANSAIVEFETNFGMMDEFDTPQQIIDYPNYINSNSSRRTTNAECITGDNCDVDLRYFGFKYAITDTFKWFDGGYVYDYQDAVNQDFFINIYVGGETFSHRVEDTGQRWLFGNFYHELPTSTNINGASFTLTTEPDSDPDGVVEGVFIFDETRTRFFASDQPVLKVPETGTFALFLAGAIGLCVRRQMKQQS